MTEKVTGDRYRLKRDRTRIRFMMYKVVHDNRDNLLDKQVGKGVGRM